MTFSIVLQFIVVLAAIWMGARYSGVALGLWNALGTRAGGEVLDGNAL